MEATTAPGAALGQMLDMAENAAPWHGQHGRDRVTAGGSDAGADRATGPT